MKDILEKYYEIKIKNYSEYNEGIIFYVYENYYYFTKCYYDENYINELFSFCQNLNKSNVKLHDFVFNKNSQLISEGFILFKLNVLMCDIDLNDLKKFSSINCNEYLKDYIFMDKFWEDKIDYLEIQMTELSNNKLINNSFDYFVGIAEVLIGFLKKNFQKNNVNLCLSHKSLTTLSTVEFYNPLNVGVDLPLKDIAAYIRIKNDHNLLYELLDKQNYNDYQYLFVRMTFPFNYFYEVSNVLLDNKNNKSLIKIVDGVYDYEKYLLTTEKAFGIYIFSWIKKE